MFTPKKLTALAHNAFRTVIGASLLAGGLSLAAGCSSAPGVPEDNSAACFGDQCPAECTADIDCGAGSYCSDDGTCVSDCTPGGDECGEGFYCSNDGRCVGTTDTGGQSSEPETTICVRGSSSVENQTPTVVLLVDQSGSMHEDLSDGVTRWDGLQNALVDENQGIIKALESDVRFGLALYTSENGNQGGQCPMLNEVGVSLGNFASIRDTYLAASPSDDTPTAESIEAVAQNLAAYDAPGPKVIILATDGEPDNCEDPNQHDDVSRELSISAAETAFGQGINTYVISVGEDIGEKHLRDMANAGAGLEIGGTDQAPFYRVNDQQALTDAVGDIVTGVRSCIFDLDGAVDPAMAHTGAVTLDGNPIAYGSDWRLNTPTSIRLVGAACDRVAEGNHQVEMEFSCDIAVELPEVL